MSLQHSRRRKATKALSTDPYIMVVCQSSWEREKWHTEFFEDIATADARAKVLATHYHEVRVIAGRMRARFGPRDIGRLEVSGGK